MHAHTSTPLGIPGHKYSVGLTPEEAGARVAVLKKVLAARLENKSARNEGHASCLRRSLRFSDTAGNGTLNHAQWLSAFERLGAQLAEADVELLFYAFATAPDGGGGDGHGDAAPYVAYHHFIEAMTSADGGLLRGDDFVTKMAERHKAAPREGKRTYDDRLFKKPPPYALGDSEPGMAARRVPDKSTNTPSQAGGIFGAAPPVAAPVHPSIKNKSSVSLSHAEWHASSKGEQPSAFGATVKRQSNNPSVPGGIFAPGPTEGFRPSASLFVRQGY